MDFRDDWVNYEIFGARGGGVTDDMQAICEAHEYANAHGLSVRTKPKLSPREQMDAHTVVVEED